MGIFVLAAVIIGAGAMLLLGLFSLITEPEKNPDWPSQIVIGAGVLVLVLLAFLIA